MCALENAAATKSEGFFKQRSVTWVWLVLLLLAPPVLWLLPAGFFDNGQTICPSKLFFDIECLGCGMTRAVMHFHHFNFGDAAYYNRGVFIVYPVLVFLWITWVIQAARRVGIIKRKQ